MQNRIAQVIRLLAVTSVVFILRQPPAAAQNEPVPDPGRYLSQIESFTQWDSKNSYPQNAILFVGSSSIRMWQTGIAFPELPIINRGFGGAHISDMLCYFEETISKYKPNIVVFHCGDNDIATGLSVDFVYDNYLTFIKKLTKCCPDTKLIYIPVKPSMPRWNKWIQMQKLNQKIADYNKQYPNLYFVDTVTPLMTPENQPNPALFLEDSLHLNAKGYTLWNTVLKPLLEELYK